MLNIVPASFMLGMIGIVATGYAAEEGKWLMFVIVMPLSVALFALPFILTRTPIYEYELDNCPYKGQRPVRQSWRTSNQYCWMQSYDAAGDERPVEVSCGACGYFGRDFAATTNALWQTDSRYVTSMPHP